MLSAQISYTCAIKIRFSCEDLESCASTSDGLILCSSALRLSVCVHSACIQSHLSLFSDYPTVDGTGVRDYIHVVDLARGHVVALEQGMLAGKTKATCETYNLGSGKGSSVLEVVAAAEKASGKKIPYKLVIIQQTASICSSYCFSYY